MKDIIENHHKNCRKKTKKKLYNSLIAKRSRWAKENSTTPQEIEHLIRSFIGKPCLYCKEKLDAKNISLDHITPITRGGKKNIKNLTIICKRCNTRKGSLSRPEFIKLLDFLDTIKDGKDYVLRKLSSKTFF
jgi:5-methylcytosine-specific restriction endonuclease McrA